MIFHSRGISESTRLCGLLLPISAGGFGLLCLVRQSSCPQIHDSFTRRRGGGRAAGMLSASKGLHLVWQKWGYGNGFQLSVSVQECESIPGWFEDVAQNVVTLDGEVSAMAVRNEGGGGVRVSPPHMGRAVSCQKRRFSSVKNDPSLSRNCALHQSRSFSSHTLVFDFDFCTCLMWVPQVGGRGVALVRGWWGSSEFLLWSGLDQISFGPNCRYHHLILRLTWEVTRVERVVFDDLPQWPQCALAHAMGTQTRSRGGVLHPGMLFFKKGDLQLLH